METISSVDQHLITVGECLASYCQNTAKEIAFVEQHRAFFEQFESLPSIGTCSINLYFADHETVIKYVRYFGGKWKKEYDAKTITYRKIVGSAERNINLWNCAPPATCKLVETEVDVPEQIIPAHKEKKFKLQCKEPSDVPSPESSESGDTISTSPELVPDSADIVEDQPTPTDSSVMLAVAPPLPKEPPAETSPTLSGESDDDLPF